MWTDCHEHKAARVLPMASLGALARTLHGEEDKLIIPAWHWSLSCHL
jgi:hypothetical protein